MKKYKRRKTLNHFPEWQRPIVSKWRYIWGYYLWGDVFPTGIQSVILWILGRCECWSKKESRRSLLCNKCQKEYIERREAFDFFENLAYKIMSETQ